MQDDLEDEGKMSRIEVDTKRDVACFDGLLVFRLAHDSDRLLGLLTMPLCRIEVSLRHSEN